MTRSAARVTSSGFGSFTCGYEQEHHQRGHALVALPGA
ncbi:MAG: hypothetical protein K0S35_2965, partial [Geminicoccaceae bacterium]|nr:hypothetical protein [Geminicoccaceae bacterium]